MASDAASSAGNPASFRARTLSPRRRAAHAIAAALLDDRLAHWGDTPAAQRRAVLLAPGLDGATRARLVLTWEQLAVARLGTDDPARQGGRRWTAPDLARLQRLFWSPAVAGQLLRLPRDAAALWFDALLTQGQPLLLLPKLSHPACPAEVRLAVARALVNTTARVTPGFDPLSPLRRRGVAAWQELGPADRFDAIEALLDHPASEGTPLDVLLAGYQGHLISRDLLLRLVADPRLDAAGRATWLRRLDAMGEGGPFRPILRGDVGVPPLTGAEVWPVLERLPRREGVRLLGFLLRGPIDLARLLADGPPSRGAWSSRGPVGRLLVRRHLAQLRAEAQQVVAMLGGRPAAPREGIGLRRERELLGLVLADPAFQGEAPALVRALLDSPTPPLELLESPWRDRLLRWVASMDETTRAAWVRPLLAHRERAVRTFALLVLGER